MDSRALCGGECLPSCGLWLPLERGDGYRPGPCVSPGADSPVHRRLDGALDVGPGPGPRQLLHPILDSSGGPAWHWAPSTQLPCPLAHWGPRHGCRGLAWSFSLLPHPSCTFCLNFFLLFPFPRPHSTLPPLSRDFTLIPNSHYFQWEFLYIEPSLYSKNSGRTDGLR